MFHMLARIIKALLTLGMIILTVMLNLIQLLLNVVAGFDPF